MNEACYYEATAGYEEGTNMMRARLSTKELVNTNKDGSRMKNITTGYRCHA